MSFSLADAVKAFPNAFTAHNSFGATATPNSDNILNISETVALPVGGFHTLDGIRENVTYNFSDDWNVDVFMRNMTMNVNSGGHNIDQAIAFGVDAEISLSADSGYLGAMQFTASLTGPSNTARAFGLNGVVSLDAGTRATEFAAGISTAALQFDAADTTTKLYGLYVRSVAGMCKLFGVRIPAISGGAENWGFYSEGAGLNSFGDDLEWRSTSKGPVLIDRVTGFRRRIVCSSGVLSTEAA